MKTTKNKKVMYVGIGLAIIIGFYFLNKKYQWIGKQTDESDSSDSTDSTATNRLAPPTDEEPIYVIPPPTKNTPANVAIVKKATAGRG